MEQQSSLYAPPGSQRCTPTAAAAILLQELRVECNSMGDEQRAWLAVHFVTCQQRTTRDTPFTCNRSRGIKACLSSMDARTNTEYAVFLGNVHSMCLFLQNQRFQELTARMVNDMAAGSRAANATLAAISRQLEDQQERLEGAQTQLGRLQELQEETYTQAAKGAEGVDALISRTEDLSKAMAQSLQLSDDIISLQGAAVVGLDNLVERHAAHTRDAEAQWEALAQGGRALAERRH
ncbi:hypothetical protein MNEG_1659 [Monoraphidium neglectum]|uniref:Uncharacterized protein n=1 Tax=Monoraphidium neglectum TaxID=145388 RepID=A0A0D2MUS1_9CHLO|nr:hypothetical protein MNEG_1659 [Monoraphidium neglectum]KIZ06295.1 hypothetical protein MNEG_1659 [Monoraphidium neglectum]|eukprot:XP_013905314.1 hypothetical protein MNEG_1659 [Monoraphidium neglectum]